MFTRRDDGRLNFVEISLHGPPLLLDERQAFFEAFSLDGHVEQLIGVVRYKKNPGRNPRHRAPAWITATFEQNRMLMEPGPRNHQRSTIRLRLRFSQTPQA